MQIPAPAQAAAPVAVSTASPVAITATSADVYRAAKAARNVLGDQLDNLEGMRRELSQQLQNGGLNPIDQKGLEQRLTDVNARITAMDKAISDQDAQVAKAASVPGATLQPPPLPRRGPPEEFYALSAFFIGVVLLPMSIAFSRRIWRRAVNTVPNLPKELYERLTRLDQAVESIAVEVERVGEAQRFMTNVMTEQGGARALGAGPAERIDVREREKVGVRRGEY